MSLHAYNNRVQELRQQEYPALQSKTYLDHAGTTLYPKALISEFSTDLISHVYGNPHSASTPSALAGQRVDEIREKTLDFFGADPKHFDLVFVANATAAMKLVMDAFRDHTSAAVNGTRKRRKNRRQFWYGYHRDSHNSLVGIREVANGGHHCFGSDEEVEAWIASSAPSFGSKSRSKTELISLFAYPGQSNMTGRRLPLSWPGIIRSSPHSHIKDTYTLLDAAALATTAPLNPVFSDPASAPDFTCLSFYKIFGFPDLGGLIIRKTAAVSHILQNRHYFGGGTVDMVTVLRNPSSPSSSTFHFKKTTTLHETLEDGTLPFHSIIALDAALATHSRLFTSMSHVSAHTAALTQRLHAGLQSLRHSTGTALVRIYNDPHAVYGDARTQGATVALNVQRPDGSAVAPSLVEAAANASDIYLRSGSLCNPGGAAAYLGWSGPELRRLYERGMRCGGSAVVGGRPVGVVRVSLGAGSTVADVDVFLEFLGDEYLDCDVVDGGDGVDGEVGGEEGKGEGMRGRKEMVTFAVRYEDLGGKKRGGRHGVGRLLRRVFCVSQES